MLMSYFRLLVKWSKLTQRLYKLLIDWLIDEGYIPVHEASAPLHCRADAQAASADALRLARHAMARGKLLQQLLQRLATVPETVELARATGLTLPQILYNAQMIRTWSLLLRNAQRQGCLTHLICLTLEA